MLSGDEGLAQCVCVCAFVCLSGNEGLAQCVCVCACVCVSVAMKA
jgi:hypothetical protein